MVYENLGIGSIVQIHELCDNPTDVIITGVEILENDIQYHGMDTSFFEKYIFRTSSILKDYDIVCPGVDELMNWTEQIIEMRHKIEELSHKREKLIKSTIKCQSSINRFMLREKIKEEMNNG